jgi:hypothetical protein
MEIAPSLANGHEVTAGAIQREETKLIHSIGWDRLDVLLRTGGREVATHSTRSSRESERGTLDAIEMKRWKQGDDLTKIALREIALSGIFWALRKFFPRSHDFWIRVHIVLKVVVSRHPSDGMGLVMCVVSWECAEELFVVDEHRAQQARHSFL